MSTNNNDNPKNNNNDNPKSRRRVAGYVEHAHKHLSPEQRGAIVNATIAHKDLLMSDRDVYDDPTSESSETMIGFAVRAVLRENPELAAAPVDALALAKAVRAEYEDKCGATMPAAGWLETLKRVEGMDALARLKEAARLKLALVPASDAPAPKEEVTSKVGPRLFRDMSSDELDQIIKARTGIEPYTLTAARRKAFHDNLRQQDPVRNENSQFDQATKSGAITRPLTPVERIAAHRRAQAAAGAK